MLHGGEKETQADQATLKLTLSRVTQKLTNRERGDDKHMNDHGQDAVHGSQSQQTVVQISHTASVVGYLSGQAFPFLHEHPRRMKCPSVQSNLKH